MRSLRAYRQIGVIAVLAVAALPCFAAKVAVLKNGFSIRHERSQVIGDVTRLYITKDGSSFVDVATAQIDHFEDAPAQPDASIRPASSPNSPSFGIPRAQTPSDSPAVFPASSAKDLNQVVNEASGKYQLDPDLVNSVIKAESGFHVHAVSPKGAQGLMQLMPGTASQLGVPNVFDPRANVEGGTKYLRELMERYNFDIPKALAAYNAGPQRVEQFRGIPPYYETRAYVARIVKDFNKKKIAQQKAAAAAKKAATSKTATSKVRSGTTTRKPAGSVHANAALGSQ
ncbi:MAG TPA: lytic transglycosylase domain-containing protein [Candidatus Sulfotelmatobacter sp.]|nr:lytic transglycosylase domain-containing protein [Candidatus Sulfotelmatobacter sp.]